MKMLITEKQLSKILRQRKLMNKEVDETDDTATSAASATSPSSSSSSDTTSTSSTSASTSERGSSPSAEDYPPYPEVDHAEDLVKRGVANPVDSTKKHEDYPEANPVRGRANPIKGM
jgi:hypothetical protein